MTHPDKALEEMLEQDCRSILRYIPARKLAGKSILVTGAAGFLGQSVIRTLALANAAYQSGALITGISLHKPSPSWGRWAKENAVRLEARDLSLKFSISKRYDYIFHAAGYAQPARFMRDSFGTVAVNVAATRVLLDAARRSGGTLVFFSSAEVYGDIPKEMIPVREEYNGNCSTLLPRSIYGESKRLGEALCAEWARRFGVAARIARISHVYGPGLPKTDTRVMSDLIRQALTEGRIALLDAGRAVKTYGYIADVTAMILWAVFSGTEPVYNIGGRDSVSIMDLARRIGDLCGVPVEHPHPAAPLEHIGRDPRIVKLNVSKVLKNMKGFSFTRFPRGLQRTIEWSRRVRGL